MNRRAFFIFVACAAIGLPCHPSSAQDGFSGSYQQAPPQQWQPIGAQAGVYGAQPQYAPAQQPSYQQGAPNYQQAPPNYQQGGDAGRYGMAPPQQQLYGFASQQAPPQMGGQQGPPPAPQQWQNGNYYGGPTGYQGPSSAPPPMQPMQPQQNLQAQADGYFNQVDQSANNSQEEEAPQGESLMKKGLKTLAGVGGAVAAGYLLNKAAAKNPMMRPAYPGMGYPPGMMPGMGYPGGMMPGMGYPMMPGMGMGGMGYPMMPGMGMGY